MNAVRYCLGTYVAPKPPTTNHQTLVLMTISQSQRVAHIQHKTTPLCTRGRLGPLRTHKYTHTHTDHLSHEPPPP